MIKKMMYRTLLIALCWLSAHAAQAQCTTSAGTLTPIDQTMCKGTATIIVGPTANPVLEADDLLTYVVHTGSATQFGAVVASGSTGTITISGLQPGTYALAAVAASRILGTMLLNYNDPCLDFEHAGILVVNDAPAVLISSSGAITCATPQVLVALSVSGASPFTTQWSGPGIISSTSTSAMVNQQGLYTATVTNAEGCVGTASIFVQSGGVPVLYIRQSNIDPCDTDPAEQELSVIYSGGQTATGYLWSNGASTETIIVPNTAGTHCVTVSFPNNCTIPTCITVEPASGFHVEIEPNPFCDSSVFYLGLTDFHPGATYLWSNGGTWSDITVTTPGTYTVTVTLPEGCSQSAAYVVEGTDLCYHLAGNVVGDMDSNCGLSAGDIDLAGITISIQDLANNYSTLAVTQSDGSWSQNVPFGNYTIAVVPPNAAWSPCLAAQAVQLTADTVVVPAFFLKPVESCPRLEVDLVTPFLRRCLPSQYTLQYCNNGTLVAEDAYIDLVLDPFIDFDSASIAATAVGSNTYRFELGDVPVGACGTIVVHVVVSCNAILGQTHCSTATSFPNAPCGELLGNWSGASLQITAECDNGELTFTLQNVGNAPMTIPLEYVVIEDVVMMKMVPPPSVILANGDTWIETLPANGSTWRVEAVQEPNHPGNSFPSLSVEGCTTGASFTTGYVNQFPVNDEDFWVDTDCTVNVGSFDPNDKQGFPVGYGPDHQIGRGIELEYLVRFQNTGTDTAFTVVIRDELSQWLDHATLRPGASSHVFTYDYAGEGTQLKFTFEHINLPDSSKSQAGSQGFVSYRIKVRDDVPFGTIIENRAGIFFDFNEPVITNTTRHRVDTNYLLVSSWEPVWKGGGLAISPNPMSDRAVLQINGLPATAEDLRIEIIDLLGRVVVENAATGATINIERGALVQGSYGVRIISGNQLVGTARLLVR